MTAPPLADAIAAAYSATGGAWQRGPGRIYDRLAEVLMACSPVPADGRSFVDVGSGTGAAARAALRAGAAGVVSVDAALGMVAFSATSRPPATVADARRLPLRNASFGGAVAAFSLNHLDDPSAGLVEMMRVVAPGSPVLASAYAADDRHPVRAAVEEALLAHGWRPSAWVSDLRSRLSPQLATKAGCEAATDAAGIEATIHEVRESFPGLGPDDLIAWRLGMAQHAPFVATLDHATRAHLVADARQRLGASPPLERSMIVIVAIKP